MSWNATYPLDTSKLRVSAGYIRNNNAALQAALSSATLSAGIAYIPTTAPIWFYVDVAPTGWTLVPGLGDCLIAVKGTSGGTVYNTSGGTVAGNWNGAPVALTPTQLPTGVKTGSRVGAGTYFAASNQTDQSFTYNGTAGATHQHNWGTLRPQARMGIICTKNYP